MAAGGGTKAVVAALLANLGIAVAKFVGYVITQSAALLAEAVHSLADSGNQVLLLWGDRRAKAPESPERPFGSGRERYFWSFVVALVLFSLGSLFSLYEGIHKYQEIRAHPDAEREPLTVAIIILVLAIGLESWSFRTAIRESRPLKGDQSWWRFIRTSRNPELPVVLLEDLGAEIGLFIALIGVLLAQYVNPLWDAYATLGIAALLGVIATFLAIEMKSSLIGETATTDVLTKIRATIESSPRVERLIHMRTIHMGPDELLVAAKLEMADALAFDEVAAAIDEVESAVRAAVPAAKYVYLEPAVYSAPTP